MKSVRIALLLSLLLATFSCTHDISIKPLDLDYVAAAEKINGKCGICISDDDLKSEVKEGGGDKYRYNPYEDFKFGLGTAFKQSCNSVGFYEDKQEAMEQGSQVIIVPKIETKSKGGFWLWPPADFTFTVDADVFDQSGGLVQHVHSTGHSTADSEQWRKSFGYAGSKAMEQALKMLRELEYNKFINSANKSSEIQ